VAYDLDEQEKIAEFKAWWNQYGGLVAAVAVVAAAGFAGVNGWDAYQQRQATQASAVYDQLQKALAGNDAGRVHEATDILIDQYSRSAYAEMAALVAAHASAAKGDLKDARARLEWASQNAADEEYRWIAKVRLAGVLIDMGAPDDAMKALEGKPPGSFLSLVAERRGDIDLVQNKFDDAKAAYQEAIAQLEHTGPEAQAGLRGALEQKIDALSSATPVASLAAGSPVVASPVKIPEKK